MDADGPLWSAMRDVWDHTLAQGALSKVDFVDALRGGFLLVACAILAANSISATQRRFVSYGPRAASPPSSCAAEEKSQHSRKSPVTSLLDWISTWSVPHSFFIHFYVVSVISSVLWGVQLATRGWLLTTLASLLSDARMKDPSMSINQIVIGWALFTIQGVRRLIECVTLSKPSTSKMWFGHWLFGLAYYIPMGVAIWIEGTGTLLSYEEPLREARLSAPSLKTMFGLPVFIIASGIQYDCHCYLASLKKYTLPSHPAFARVICPHYTAECALYFSLSVLTAPKGVLINRTVFAGFILTVVNLGISAGISKEWYKRKFGSDKVEDRWKMIPRVY